MKKHRKYKCCNPDLHDCSGSMHVFRTTTLSETVLRERRCTVCGYILMTRELVDEPEKVCQRKIVSFSQMQKEAMRRNR